jgi:tRNA-5-methyluridine54 2-sulfurtransferase
MKCRKCGATASIHMPQHRLALCKNHYLDWFLEQTQKNIEKYRMAEKSDQILVAVSGGKDSLVLWDALSRLGYSADGLYIHLGITADINYSPRSLEYCRMFAEEHQLKLNVYSVEAEFGKSIPEMLETSQRGQERACSLCGLVKRRVFNKYTREHGYPIIATGHNLDDEVAVLFSNNLSWNTDQMTRQAPVLPETDYFARKIKPFCRIYERETAAYTLMRGIAYIEEECPFAVGSRTNYFKTIFNRLEKDQPGSKLFYYTRFLQEKKAGFLNKSENQPSDVHICPTCGEITASSGDCALCRVLKQND